ncbi:choice-of-anchor L domain-containing protein [Paludibaculum fermentans]|uniref:choice-of-anchor L domain-containing protein n=1 Tax=Paludibaculum fermentans TaxID=1473598 RepID=UPI003EBAFF20
MRFTRSLVVWAGVLGVLATMPLAAAIDCSAEVTAKVGATRSGYRLDRRSGKFIQTVTFKNNGATVVQGPVYFALQGLTSGVTLANSAGAAGCAGALATAPTLTVNVGSDNTLMPGETAAVVLQFTNPSYASIGYTGRVFAGLATLEPISGITVSPDGFPINTPTNVTMRALVPYPSGSPKPAVTVVRVDAGNNVIGTIGTMYDNGALANGDEIQGDGIFSAIVAMSSVAEETYRLKVKSVDGGATEFSGMFTVLAYKPISDAEFSALTTMQQNALKNFTDKVGTLGKNGALQDTLNRILADGTVDQAGFSGGDNGIWIVYKGGILGGLMLNPEGTLGGPAQEQAQLTAQGAFGMKAPVSMASAGNVEVGNKKVLLLSPFWSDLSGVDANASMKTLFEGSTCPKYDVTWLKDGAVTVDAFKLLKNYGVYIHYGHGDTYYNGILNLWEDEFGWSSWGAQVVILTGQTATAANKVTYQTDLKKGRIAILTGGSAYYAILPSFISYYNSGMPSSLVFINACRSFYNSTMANAFTGAGAKTYLAYSDYVFASFATARTNDFFNKWVLDSTNLVTTGESFTAGLKDGNTPPAEWKMTGATNLEAGLGNELQNGDFETGNLGAWTAAGDGRVVTQLGGYFYPQDGVQMGIISTGLGYTTSSGQISQKVCMPKEAKTLTFSWNFTSEEFKEWCGSQYQDYFRVSVTTETGTTNLMYVNVDSICGATYKVPFSFDRGDAYSNGWKTASLNVAAIATANEGKPVTLTFAAGDVGDSIYDTAILLDKIVINK